jgi:phosphatidate cytidylyltransferase
MLKRTLTALLLIPPVVYLIGWSPKWLFMLAIAIAVVLALREYFGLCRAMGFKVFPWIGCSAAAAMCVVWAFPPRLNPFVVALMLVVLMLLLIPIVAMRQSLDLKDYLTATSMTIFGVLYIGLSLSCLLPIRFNSEAFKYTATLSNERANALHFTAGSVLILFLFVVIWAGDISAYLVGRPMGKIPFFARISPRKTWEGAIAGLVGSVAAGWAVSHWFWTAAHQKEAILLAALIAVAGQIGDLVESAMKRGAKQKDSGTLLPGHGGFLDRIDSLLFAAPALWLALFILG